MFEKFYFSAWNHPGVAFVATVIAVAIAFRKKPFLHGFMALFALEIVFDAFMTGPLKPSQIADFDTSIAWAIVFAILGDYRYFVLVERFAPRKALAPTSLGPWLGWVLAIPWAFLVPLTWTLLYKAKIIEMPDESIKFLVYELLFAGVALVLRFVVLPMRMKGASDDAKKYVMRLTTFEIVQYALWASADFIILFTSWTLGEKPPVMSDLGYLLRVVPNVMYYGGFLGFAWLSAPRSLMDAKSATPAEK